MSPSRYSVRVIPYAPLVAIVLPFVVLRLSYAGLGALSSGMCRMYARTSGRAGLPIVLRSTRCGNGEPRRKCRKCNV